MDALFIKRLQQQEWKGNIRELKNAIERAVILVEGSELRGEDIPFELQTGLDDSTSFGLEAVEKSHIQKVLHYTNGNKTKAAELLGIGVTTLYRKLDEYKIAVDG